MLHCCALHACLGRVPPPLSLRSRPGHASRAAAPAGRRRLAAEGHARCIRAKTIQTPAQFEAFARGFMMLCGGPAIHLFSATELERLVCGTPLLDFDALRRNARYEGGYSAGHQARAALGRSPARRCVLVALHDSHTVPFQLPAARCVEGACTRMRGRWPRAGGRLSGRAGRARAGGAVAVVDRARAGQRGAAPLPEVLHRLRPRAHWRPGQPALRHPAQRRQLHQAAHQVAPYALHPVPCP